MFEPHSRIPGVSSGLSTMTDLTWSTDWFDFLNGIPGKSARQGRNSLPEYLLQVILSNSSIIEKLNQAWNEVARAASERATTSNLNQQVTWPNKPSHNYGKKTSRKFQMGCLFKKLFKTAALRNVEDPGLKKKLGLLLRTECIFFKVAYSRIATGLEKVVWLWSFK